MAFLESALNNAEARAGEAHERAARAEALVSSAAETLAQIQTLDPTVARLAEMERQLPAVREECRQILAQQEALSDEADRLRASTADVTDQAATLQQVSSDARESAERAARTVADVEHRLDSLSRFDAVSRDTGAQLQTLNALAERVTSKVKALEQQHDTIEHALAESRKVNEMVWNLDAQIGKLQEGTRLADRVEWSLAQLGGLQNESATQMAEAVRARAEFTERFDRQRREATALIQALEGRVDYLALNRKELDTLDQRLAAAQATITDVERRMTAVFVSEDAIRGVDRKIEAVAGRIEAVAGQAKALEARHEAFETLEDRLAQADEAVRRTSLQIESLSERHRQLEDLNASFAEFEALYAQNRANTEKLRTETQALAPVVERTVAFLQDVHALETSIRGLEARAGEVELGTRRAMELKPLLDEFAAQGDRAAARLHLLDDVQTRLNALHALSLEVDRKFAAELARDANLEAVRVVCEGLSTRLLDAQRNCEELTAAHRTFASLPERIAALEEAITRSHARMDDLHRDDEALEAQRRTLNDLTESAHTLAGELARLQDTQRGLVDGSREAQELLGQIAGRLQTLEEGRARVEEAARLAASIERRLDEATRASEAVDAKSHAIAGRERVVDAVQAELAEIHAVARKTQDDLVAIVEGQSRVAETRAETERLFETLGAVAARISELEARGAAVDDVRQKADAITGLLDDMHVAMNTVAEEKAMFDHVSEQLARLDEVLTEARGTTKALQAERKLSQRIVDNLRSLHTRHS